MVEPDAGSRWPMRVFEVALVVAACMIALIVAASTGGNDPTGPTFASAGIECAPSPDSTGQVFLEADATEYEIIAARLAIASVPGVTIDQYLDRRGAFAQRSCLFPETPRLGRSVQPFDVPVSFAVTADANSTAHLRSTPGVRAVVTPDSWTAWWTGVEEPGSGLAVRFTDADRAHHSWLSDAGA